MSLADGLITVGGELGVLLVDAVVRQVHEPVSDVLRRSLVPITPHKDKS